MSTQEEQDIYSSLNDLLDKRIGDDCTPAYWGRLLYKNTACGPWVSFVVCEQAEQTIPYTLTVRQHGDRLALTADINVPSDELLFYDFSEKDGLILSDEPRSLDEYQAMLEGYQSRELRGDHKQFTFVRQPDSLTISSKQVVPAQERQIFYEDEEAHCRDWTKKCVAIRIGSIVEGSDVEIDPIRLPFPLAEDDLEQAVQSINDQVSFYWERDNSHWYVLKKDGCWCVSFRETWGDITWDTDDESLVPDEIKAKCENIACQGDLPSLGWGQSENLVDLGGGWELVEYINDNTYL